MKLDHFTEVLIPKSKRNEEIKDRKARFAVGISLTFSLFVVFFSALYY